MKYKFNHKASHSMEALGIKNIEKSKNKLKELAEQVAKDSFPSFSSIAEVMSSVLSKREILLLATKEIINLSKQGGNCNYPSCQTIRRKETESKLSKLDKVFKEALEDLEKTIITDAKKINPDSQIEKFLEKLRQEINAKKEDGPKMDEETL